MTKHIIYLNNYHLQIHKKIYITKARLLSEREGVGLKKISDLVVTIKITTTSLYKNNSFHHDIMFFGESGYLFVGYLAVSVITPK